MKRFLLGLVFCIVFFATFTHASEVDELRSVVREQSRRIDALMSRLQKIEGQRVAPVAKGDAKLSDNALWAEKIRIKGDLRYRHELIDDEHRNHRNQHRIRTRLGIDAIVNDNASVHVVLASGSSDSPTSSNQTLDGGFSDKNIWIDQAYFDYSPEAIKDLSIWGGKLRNPFHRTSSIIWDGDVRPEGIALKYSGEFKDNIKWFANVAGLWLNERDGNDDQSLWGTQLGIATKFKKMKILCGISYYDYGNVEDDEFIYNTTDSFGNSTIDHDGNGNLEYLEDFDIFELFGEVTFDLAKKPLKLYGNYVNNISVGDSSRNDAFALGAKWGTAKKKGDWQVGYEYREVEADAVLGVFTDADPFGGSDGTSHIFSVKYALNKNMTLATIYTNSDEGIETADADDDFEKFQVDLIFKF